MEKYYLQTIGTPIIDENNNYLGKINDVVVNTETGKVVGFFTVNKKVLSPIDIIEWDENMIINSNSDIIEVDEIHHFKETLKKNIAIYQNRVFTKEGDYLGKVIDFGIDNKFFQLTCIIVAKSLLGTIFWDKRLISSQDILHIKKKEIIVKNLVRPVKMKKLKVGMVTDFP
jgi:uncharacterized protein YrrD